MASIKDLKRMCKWYSDCGDCPLPLIMDNCLPDSLPDNTDEIVDKWVAKHPVKTYAMDFLKSFQAQDTRYQWVFQFRVLG